MMGKPFAAAGQVDPITLAVVRGALETAQREMTLTLEKTGRSSVFNLAHDYSNALFDHLWVLKVSGAMMRGHLREPGRYCALSFDAT